MLRWGSTTPYWYRETSGFGARTERECGRRGRLGAGPRKEDRLMRVYVINADQIVVFREEPGTLADGESAVTSLEELRAVRLTGKQLLAVWNGLPGTERLTKVGNRETLLERLWAAMEALP